MATAGGTGKDSRRGMRRNIPGHMDRDLRGAIRAGFRWGFRGDIRMGFRWGVRAEIHRSLRRGVLPGAGLALCLVLLLGGCGSQKKSAGTGRSSANKAYDAAELAGAGNRFALDLFRQVQPEAGNMVYSPYSISTVLAMCYSGAGGETARQMSEVLYFPPAGQLETAETVLRKEILSGDTLPGTEISLANAIWAQQDFDFLPEYLDNISEVYDAPLTKMDFINGEARENSRQKINRWVEEHTRSKIRDLIAQGVLSENTRMVLTNAIYFNGKWKWTFDPGATHPSIFHVSPRETRMTPFMNMTRTVPYYEDEEIQAIRLPYRGDRFSMTVILPRTPEGWKMISRVIDLERLDKVETHFNPAEVSISLPRFRSEMKMDLRRELVKMGMDLPFGRDADFSGMTGEKNLFIDEVIHKAFIEVSESGTEAAAATGAIMSLKSAYRTEPLRFNADHPFLYCIREQRTGCIIFLGRLVRPAENG
jgi:serpin B